MPTPPPDTPPAFSLADGPAFIVLDGIDGCGKTTQAARLAAELGRARADGTAALHLREPGSTAAGEAIRALVLGTEPRLGRGTLALLFTAARRETLEQLVAPALAAGRDVVIERFHASTFAYQGAHQRDPAAFEPAPFDDAELLALLRGWAGAPAPDLELILDLPPELAFERVRAREAGAAGDRFEREGLAFQTRVRAALSDYVERVPSARLVDATGSVDEVAARVLGAVRAHRRDAVGGRTRA